MSPCHHATMPLHIIYASMPPCLQGPPLYYYGYDDWATGAFVSVSCSGLISLLGALGLGHGLRVCMFAWLRRGCVVGALVGCGDKPPSCLCLVLQYYTIITDTSPSLTQ
ncbi:hypothetical protein K504DRAFT_495614 [Pleomassaria siparia CBS 279.74]|uniref:Uncharacterized protein n=1 Tax=Pleomassaria siparia CBS 279.74 TaxID=1314801 RepID=A0A6G1JSB9_9PLEO|nr:hypothetical protein K504DRAFT_495614 [Pleomassaria siparia CBS 279.74]